jgi:hypothetical protein
VESKRAGIDGKERAPQIICTTQTPVRDILNVDDNYELVRVDEEVVFKNEGSSKWIPCLLCHKRQLWTEANVPGDESPTY